MPMDLGPTKLFRRRLATAPWVREADVLEALQQSYRDAPLPLELRTSERYVVARNSHLTRPDRKSGVAAVSIPRPRGGSR